jgi:hypothetical protein
MKTDNKSCKPKKRVINWIISGFLLVNFFVVYEVVIRPMKPAISRPYTKSLVDYVGKIYYKNIVPVSTQNNTYLMAVSYSYGFDETQERFKIYYVWYRDLSSEPLRAVVYGGSTNQLRDISQVRFYRVSTKANSPITVILSVDKENKPAETWLFTPPKVFPSELEESASERSGFRQYHEWNPPFEAFK